MGREVSKPAHDETRTGAARVATLFQILLGVVALGSLTEGLVDWVAAIDAVVRAFRVLVDAIAWVIYGWVFSLFHLSPPRGLADLSLLFAMVGLTIARAEAKVERGLDFLWAILGLALLSVLVVGYVYACVALFVWIAGFVGFDARAIEGWFVGLLVATYLFGGVMLGLQRKTQRLLTAVRYYYTLLAFVVLALINAALRQVFGLT